MNAKFLSYLVKRLLLALLTIFVGSMMAYVEKHLKNSAKRAADRWP